MGRVMSEMSSRIVIDSGESSGPDVVERFGEGVPERFA